VTLALHASWGPATVFGADLSLGPGATDRADGLFECVSILRHACDGVEGFRPPSSYKLCLTLWGALNTRLSPLQWDLMASDANTQSLAERAIRYPIVRGGQGRAPRELTFSHRP
jgi:hypothetical protein